MAGRAGGKTPQTNLTKTAAEFSLSESCLCTEVPPPPTDLDEEGCQWWKHYCGIFVRNGTLSILFLTSIHNLCIEHMVRKSIMDELTNSPTGLFDMEYIVNKDKELVLQKKLSPLVDKLEKCILAMDRLLASNGMTLYTSKIHNVPTSGGKNSAANTVPPPSSLPPPQPQSQTV